nr:hypothetical protein [Tanacetum cinerariifolium]
MDDLGGVTYDDESDSYAGQDRCGATDGTQVSYEAIKDADMSAVAHVKETKLAREIVLENKATSALDKNEGPNAKEDPSDAAIDVEHMDVNRPPPPAIVGLCRVAFEISYSQPASLCLVSHPVIISFDGAAFNTNDFLDNRRPEMHHATANLCSFA